MSEKEEPGEKEEPYEYEKEEPGEKEEPYEKKKEKEEPYDMIQEEPYLKEEKAFGAMQGISLTIDMYVGNHPLQGQNGPYDPATYPL